MNLKINLKKNLILVITCLVIGLGVGAGLTYLIIKPNHEDNQSSVSEDQQVSMSESELKQTEAFKDSEGERSDSHTLDDRQILQALTIGRAEQSGAAEFWAPVDISMSGDYARTGGLPISFSSDEGYQVVAMGGTSYFWYKKSGMWQYIGSCSMEPCQLEDGHSYEQLPADIK